MTRQDELNEAWCKYRGKCSTEIIQALAFALHWCDEHPNWISVEDKMPKEYADLLVAISNHFCYTAFCCGDKWYSNDNLNQRELSHVTHWMPLPAPPSSSEIPNNHKKGGKE